MLRYAPGHMRDMSGKDISLTYANIYSTNKTSEIEDGLSAILGFDFKINSKKDDREKFSLSMGQVFSPEKNKDLPLVTFFVIPSFPTSKWPRSISFIDRKNSNFFFPR